MLSASIRKIDVARVPMRQDAGGHSPEAARLVVLERLNDLGLGVHDERSVVHHRLADRTAAEQQHLQVPPSFLGCVRRQRQAVAGPKDGQLATADWAPLGPDTAVSRQDIGEGIEVRPPGQSDASTWG